MAGKNKRRFVVLANGRPRQLFSVSEWGKGDLNIAVRAGKNLEEVEGDAPIKSTKLSVHVSPMSDGTIIMRRMFLGDGTELSTAIYVRPPKEEFLTNAFSMACSNLEADLYNADFGTKDEVIVLSHGFPKTATLCYHVIAGLAEQQYPEFLHQALHVERFSYFSVAIYTNFINLPCDTLIQPAWFATSSLRKNKVNTNFPQVTGEGVPPMRVEEIEKRLWETNNEISFHLARRISLQLRSLKILFDEKTLQFSRFPVEPMRMNRV